MPTILLKKSDTPGSVPGTANLTNLAGGVEVAVNTADKRVYSMTSASAVIELGTNPSSLTCADASFTVARVGSLTISSLSLTNVTVTSATVTTLTGTSANITNISGTSLTVSTATLSGGTANGVLYLNGSKVATSGSALTFDGTNFGTTGNANLGSGSKSTDTQLNFASDLGTQRIYLDRGTRSLVFYDATTAIENYRIAGITGVQTWGVGGTEAMRLTSTSLYTASGINVGIGTSSPTTPLDVTKAGGGNFVANFQNTTSATPYGVSIKDAATPTAGYPLLQISNSAGSSVYFRVDSSTGNVGIGTSSPSSYSANARVLHIDGGANQAELKLTNNTSGASGVTGGLLQMAGNDFYIWNVENSFLSLGTNNTERARITSGGDLVVNSSVNAATLNNNAKLSVWNTSGSSDAKGLATGYGTTNGQFRLIYLNSAADALNFDNGNNNATLTSGGTWTNASDARLKKSILDIKYGLDAVVKSKPRSFERVDVDGEYIGFIAQELLDVVPEVVYGSEEQKYSVDYGSLVAVAFKAIQEQQAMINDLKAKVAALESK
jgi:hypothetical protein